MFTKELKSAPYYYYYFLLVLIIIISTSTTTDGKSGNRGSPCKRLVLYFHDIIYNRKNAEHATSAIVAAPAWGNKIKLAGQNHFGDLVVFDDPITLDNNFHSAHIGRAQGFYLNDRKDWFTAGLGFTFAFNSTRHYMGTMTFAGADPLNKSRDIYVILIETLRQLRSEQKHL